MAWSLDPGLLAGLVVGGVSATVLLAHLTGASRTVAVRDRADARRAFALDHEDAEVSDVWLSDDQHVALLSLADGGAGLLLSLGDNLVSRRWAAGRGPRVEDREAGLRIRLGEFAARPVTVRLADAEAKRRWRERLEA